MALDGKIAFANSYTHQLLGYPDGSLNGKDFFETLVPADEQANRRASFDKAIASGGLFEERERDYVTRSGSIRWVEVKSTIVSEVADEKYLSVIGEDISERKKVSEALSRSNAQLQDLIDNTTDLIQIIGVSGRFLFVNKAWVETMGYSEEEVKNLRLQDVLHPEFAEQTQAQWERLSKGEPLEEYTGVYRRKDGRRLYLSGSVSCRFDKGMPSAFRCILHNSTAKVRAERASKLYASIAQVAINSSDLDDLYLNIHKQLGEVIDVKNFFIAQYDPGKSYLYFPYYVDEYFNSRVHFTKRKLGNGLTEYAIMANRPLILHDEDIHQLAAEKKIYLYGVVPKVMLCVPLKIGDRVTGIIGVKSYERANKYENRDLELLDFISGQVALAIARKQAELALARETARLNAIFEGSAHLMWSVNKRLLLTSFNHDYAELMQAQLDKNPQLNISTEKLGFQLVSAAERRPLEEKYREAFRGKQQRFEIQLMTKNQEEKWLEVYLNPIFLGNGQIEEVSGIARDITELKQYQRELVEAREQAEHSLKVKEQFLANMSHEIRTPMNGVIGMVDLLADTPLNEEQKDYVGTIRKSSETLLTILNDILDLAKIEAGKMVLHPSEVVLEEVLDRLMALFSQVAQQKNNRLRYQLDPQLPKVLVVDETRLLQILSNLTSNALKFTDQGQVDILLTGKKIGKDRLNLRVEVKDTGMGISAENVDKLFTAFQQLDNSTKKVHGGTGLGLAISQEFCKMMDGTIGVHSQLGKGSTFWFTLNLAIGNSALAKPRPLALPETITGQLEHLQAKVLLVDDNATNRKVAGQILRKAGSTVVEASSGPEAMELLRNQAPFDLILMDIQMPGMDGVEASQAIKAMGLAKVPPIVAMTAYAMKEDKEKFLAAGMDGYLAKPIRAAQLLEVVNQHSAQTTQPSKADNKALKSPKSPKHAVLDAQVMDSLQAAMGGDPQLLKSMLEEFLTEAEEQLQDSLSHAQSGKVPGLQRELHTLKGNAGTFGAMELHHLVAEVEALAKKGDAQAFLNQYQSLNSAFKRLNKAVQALG